MQQDVLSPLKAVEPKVASAQMAAPEVAAEVAEVDLADLDDDEEDDDEEVAVQSERYVVVCKSVAVRAIPDAKGEVIGARSQGQFVDLYDWDPTGRWRRIPGEALGSGRSDGWMLLRHKQKGELLSKVE
mmetsp:Transcript_86707/g.176476  ORF Transcript_86707/g.176476 Transcript_86707/m.176476 type:complete len:129 (-) Transcript_86707:65-451(-)